jgi:nucleoside-diphosphate-sugar epimerase
MRVLVTGSRGYIGTVLTPMLEEAGHEVVGLDSDLYRSCTFGEELPDTPCIVKDVRDVEREDLQGFDTVMHLAGLSNDPLGDLNPELTYRVNHQASVRLARLCKEAGVSRFIFSSSCSNYGAGGNDFLTEDSPFNPVTPYGISKVLVEQDVMPLASDDFSPTFLRNSTAYGVSPRLRFDLVLNNLVAWAFTTGKVYLKSDGSAWRPIVHIRDIARAFIAVLEAPREAVHNRAFNVGRNEDNYRIREIARIVKETVPGCELQFAEGASADKRNYRVDCSRLPREIPAFKPQWNARLGAQELYEAYRTYGITLEDFEGPKYQRIAHIKHLIGAGELSTELRRQPEYVPDPAFEAPANRQERRG